MLGSAAAAKAAAKAAGRVRKGGPLNGVRHNLFGALEIAHKSVCDVSQQSCEHLARMFLGLLTWRNQIMGFLSS